MCPGLQRVRFASEEVLGVLEREGLQCRQEAVALCLHCGRLPVVGNADKTFFFALYFYGSAESRWAQHMSHLDQWTSKTSYCVFILNVLYCVYVEKKFTDDSSALSRFMVKDLF